MSHKARRLVQLDQFLLGQRQPVSIKTIAERFEVCRRTLIRDLEFLRRRCQRRIVGGARGVRLKPTKTPAPDIAEVLLGTSSSGSQSQVDLLLAAWRKGSWVQVTRRGSLKVLEILPIVWANWSPDCNEPMIVALVAKSCGPDVLRVFRLDKTVVIGPSPKKRRTTVCPAVYQEAGRYLENKTILSFAC